MLLAPRRGVRRARAAGRRELVHVRDLGLAAGGPLDPRRGLARRARPPARRGPLALHPFATLWRRLLRRGLFQPRDPARAPDGRAAHAVRRVRARERRRRAREPEGLRGDRARVRALPRGPSAPIERRLPRRPQAGRPAGRAALPARRRSRATTARAGERDPKARAELGRAREPRDRLPRADPPPARDPRGARRRRTRRRRTSGGARSRRCFPRRVAARPPSGSPPRSAPSRRALQRAASAVAREVITESFMVLSLPGRVLALGANLADEYPEPSASPRTPTSRAARALRAGPARSPTTAARATGRTSTSGCTTSSTSSARSTRTRSCSTRRSARRSSRAWAGGSVPDGAL